MDSNVRPPGCAGSQHLQDSIALHQVTALLVVFFCTSRLWLATTAMTTGTVRVWYDKFCLIASLVVLLSVQAGQFYADCSRLC